MKHHQANQHMYNESSRKIEREKDVKIIGKKYLSLIILSAISHQKSWRPEGNEMVYLNHWKKKEKKNSAKKSASGKTILQKLRNLLPLPPRQVE